MFFNYYKRSIILIIILFSPRLFIMGNNDNLISINYGSSCEVIITINPAMHMQYGFAYPITYELDLHSDSQMIDAYHKHQKYGNWDIVTTKNENDFFNGIEAVRFDYQNSKAFVSIAFAANSDTIFIKFLDENNNYIKIDFRNICKYYDNRKAVVTTTADDLSQNDNGGFAKAFREFRRRKLWLSCGAITGGFTHSSWEYLQGQVDSGYLEIDSHSRTHVPYPYPDLESEVMGSSTDIKNNLELPELYRKGDEEYVYAYIYPYGNWSSTIDAIAGENGYIICRTVRINEMNLTDWNDELNLFNRVGAIYEIGADDDGVHGISDIATLNQTFDSIVNQGKVYHFTIHPKHIESHGDWGLPYMSEHLDYISNRKNIWYVGFGHLYLYNLITIQNEVPVCSNIDIKVFLEGSYVEAGKMDTSINQVINFSQPFNTQPMNYEGSENIIHIPTNDIVDWVLVSLYSNLYDTHPVAQRAGLITTAGKIVDLDGKSTLRFNAPIDGYYVKVEHRNHLSVMSGAKINLSE